MYVCMLILRHNQQTGQNYFLKLPPYTLHSWIRSHDPKLQSPQEIFTQLSSNFHHPTFIQLSSNFHPTFIQLSSNFHHPTFIQLSSNFHPTIIQLSSNFHPTFIQLSSNFHPTLIQDCLSSYVSAVDELKLSIFLKEQHGRTSG
jgi:hypothetical protein